MPEPATTEAPLAETTPAETPATEPKGLSVPMGDIIAGMMPTLSEESKAVLNKGSAKEAPAPPPPAPLEKPDDAPASAAATEPAKEKGTLAEFLPPEAQSDKPPPKATESAAIQELSEADKMLPEDVKGKKGQERWHKITATADAAIAEATRLRTENEHLKSAPKVDEDTRAYVTQLEGRLQEMSSRFERVALMEHPAIQDQFIAPRAAEFEAATKLLKEVEIDPGILERALAATGKARIDALDELTDGITSPTVKIKIHDHVAKIEHFDQELAKAMTDVKGTHERLATEDRVQRHRAAQEQLKQVNTLYDSAIDYLRDQGFEYLKKNGNPKFDEIVDTIVKEGRTILTETDNPQQLAMAAVGLPLALRFRNAWLTTAKQLQAANAELADLKGSTPGLNGGSSTSTAAPAAATVTPQRGAVEIAMENIRGGSV